MIENFRQLINRLKDMPPQRICVAAAEDENVLQAVRETLEEDMAGVVLVGHQERIWRAACRLSLDLNKVRLIHHPDPRSAVPAAIEAVSGGEAEVLVNGGGMGDAEFLQALAGIKGPGAAGLPSYLAAFEIPGFDRLLYITDGGANAFPGFEEKAAILKNAVAFLKTLGLTVPRVAMLSANEKVSTKMPVTVEARELALLARREFDGAVAAEGPMALDVAVSREAAQQKKLQSPVAAGADLLLAPNAEVAGLVGESIIHLARGRMAAVMLGYQRPVVVDAGSGNRFTRLYSLALACCSAANGPPFGRRNPESRIQNPEWCEPTFGASSEIHHAKTP